LVLISCRWSQELTRAQVSKPAESAAELDIVRHLQEQKHADDLQKVTGHVPKLQPDK
jgi:hypothetical protein